MDTQLFVYKNGLQIIAKKIAKTEEGVFWVERPARVITQVDKNSGKLAYALEPHLPLVDRDTQIDIREADLLHAPLKPSSELLNGYTEATSGLVLPTDGRSILNG